MKIGLIGLGRMGMSITERLLSGKHEVVVFDILRPNVFQMESGGATGAESIEDLVGKLVPPRIIWLMLPCGDPVETTIESLSDMLSPEDIIIDGGNTCYKDDLHRAEDMKKKGIRYIDAGVSGGIWGVRDGFCIMLGGDSEDINHIAPILKTLAVKDGYAYCGPTGAGHFVKMIHNGIEYALMEAYGEGFELLKASPYHEYYKLDEIARLWNSGSVIRSWLLSLVESALLNDPDLDSIKGFVNDTGMGRWTVEEAVRLGVSAPIIAASLFKRFQSGQEDVFSNKVIAGLRKEFGGHQVKYKK
ncbi:MAG: decarboxylating 6-phosphogluconate dehydrogenase [Candidatus Latescibacterota bacterium]